MESTVCSICYEDIDSNITNNNDGHITDCKHIFHKGCIKIWYKTNHPSCDKCPICRSNLNVELIDSFNTPNFVTNFEEFSRLDGVAVFGGHILILMNSFNWKILLKNLLILTTTQNLNFDKTSIFIHDEQGRKLKFGFVMSDIGFTTGFSTQISLYGFNDAQLENLKYLDKLLLEISNNNSIPHSILKNNEFMIDRIKIIANFNMSTHQYKISDCTKVDCKDYSVGRCDCILCPEIITASNRTYYILKCVQFGLIEGHKCNKF